MNSRLLITQALDEKEFLIKKINAKIHNASFVDTKRRNEETVFTKKMTEEEFRQKAESAYQQIQDLIARYEKISAAILASNAATMIQTSYGSFTVAAAIALRERLRSKDRCDKEVEFEKNLEQRMTMQYKQNQIIVDEKNGKLAETAESMRMSILGKESRSREDKPLEVVNEYVKENTVELIDPLDIHAKMEALRMRRETLLTELETQIKVSNATTYIEV